jgi:hypothetical protein
VLKTESSVFKGHETVTSVYRKLLRIFIYQSNIEFDVHGSVHHGNAYVQLKVQLDIHVFVCILFSSLLLALHVSGAICTHPQEHKFQRTAIGVCNGFGMLMNWSKVFQLVHVPMD